MISRIACIITCALALMTGCQQKPDDSAPAATPVMKDSANQALYEEVMRVHDEVMPKMNDLYKAKTALQTRLKLPGLPEADREHLNIRIARIDSASERMMVWMRQFNPPADSVVGEQKARQYLEAELAKIEKVKEDILEALEMANVPE